MKPLRDHRPALKNERDVATTLLIKLHCTKLLCYIDLNPNFHLYVFLEEKQKKKGLQHKMTTNRTEFYKCRCKNYVFLVFLPKVKVFTFSGRETCQSHGYHVTMVRTERSYE